MPAADAHADAWETHISVLFAVGDVVVKMKKAVQLDFIDFRRVEDRRRACEQELALNQRFSPDVYVGLGEVDVPAMEVAEPVVVMKRMPAEARLSTLAADGADIERALNDVARQVAVVHAASPAIGVADAAAFASADVLASRWATNHEVIRNNMPGGFAPALVDEIDALAQEYVAGRRPLFERRIADGRVRDGHGDLRAEDIFCLSDGPRILDCLDFDAALRIGDQLADVAFLAMDLEALGRKSLALRFLLRYAELAADRWPSSLAHHYIAYRASVRAKVDCLQAAQGLAGAEAQAVTHLELALKHVREGKVRLLMIGGAPGTGKSSLAANLADQGYGVVLSSDEIRKELAGLAPTDPAEAGYGDGIYLPAMTDAAYEELNRRARELLALGESVLLDASWSSEPLRDRARQVGRELGAQTIELVCECPVETAARRIHQRRTGPSTSDATTAIAEVIRQNFDPWPIAMVVDTAADEATSAAAAQEALEDVLQSR